MILTFHVIIKAFLYHTVISHFDFLSHNNDLPKHDVFYDMEIDFHIITENIT